MAKKGGAQQLQQEINSDEELYRFLDRPGLCVMDVYSEWCGPCVAMIGCLRKLKLEMGGDILHLAICKSDTIDAFERFRNKSEPVWLFATRGKLVNIMFGTDVPKLTAMMAKELSMVNITKRQFFNVNELLPIERARRDKIEGALAEQRRIEQEEAARVRLEYLMHCTDEIINNLHEMGVAIFGPHVVRDIFKKIWEVAETHKIQCKDRHVFSLTPEQFDIVNFACDRPLDPDVLEQMYNKECMVAFLKVQDAEKSLEHSLLEFAKDLTTAKKDDDGEVPPVLVPLEIKISTKLEGEPEKDQPEEVVEEAAPEPAEEAMPEIGMGMDIGMEGGDAGEGEPEKEEEAPPEEEVIEVVPSETSSDAQIILIPPIWVPTDRRTHATLIYVFFRSQTAPFLPPDPVPDPPHVVMCFDAYKKKDLVDVMKRHEENILAYGFFTSEDPNKTQCIATSIEAYGTGSIRDKLVLKVAKKTSHTMLAFVPYGPIYVSANTKVGKEDADKFFPEGYGKPPPEKEAA